MNEEVEKVIAQPTETVVPLLGRMKFVTGVRPREPEALLDHEPILGYRHRIEGMGAHEAGHHRHTGAAHVLLREETLVHPPTKDEDPHQEGSRPEEMKELDHRPKNGAQNRPTVVADHATHPVLATARDGYAIQPLAAKSSDPRDETGLLS